MRIIKDVPWEGVRLLQNGDDIGAFSCGEPEVDDWLHKRRNLQTTPQFTKGIKIHMRHKKIHIGGINTQ